VVVLSIAVSMPHAMSLSWAKQDRDARIKSSPQTAYPTLASWFGIEGYCEVRFAIDEEGFPFAVEPACTRKVFCFEAKRAVSGASFYPKMVDGVPTVRTNVVYPMEYFFEGSDYDVEVDRNNLEPCENKAVS
jgi:outer membrane biosynthesis protein TonB